RPTCLTAKTADIRLSMTQIADEQLIERYRSGDREAMSLLVARHIDFVYSVARRRVGDVHLAEDVTQAVFLILCRKAASLRHGTVLEGWLFETTRFAANNAMRSPRRKQHYEHAAAREHREEEEERMENSETSAAMEQQLNSLGRA